MQTNKHSKAGAFHRLVFVVNRSQSHSWSRLTASSPRTFQWSAIAVKEKNCTIQAAKECRAVESSVQSRMWNAVQCKTVSVNCEVKFWASHYTAVLAMCSLTVQRKRSFMKAFASKAGGGASLSYWRGHKKNLRRQPPWQKLLCSL